MQSRGRQAEGRMIEGFGSNRFEETLVFFFNPCEVLMIEGFGSNRFKGK